MNAHQGPYGSTDPLYDNPFVDLDAWRDRPMCGSATPRFAQVQNLGRVRVVAR